MSRTARRAASPRALLASAGFPGPGPGRLALVVAPAGVGKSALLTHLGIDEVAAGRDVAHLGLDRPHEKILAWYHELWRRRVPAGGPEREVREIARHVRVLAFGPAVADAAHVERTLELLAREMAFAPDAILADGLDAARHSADLADPLLDRARRLGADVWAACRIRTRAGESPSLASVPADWVRRAELVFALRPRGRRIGVEILRHGGRDARRALPLEIDGSTWTVRPADPAPEPPAAVGAESTPRDRDACWTPRRNPRI